MKAYILANGNKRVSEHDTEQEAQAARDEHNARALDLNTEQAHVCTQDEYAQQLEAAVVSMEGLHAAQKQDLKRQAAELKAQP